MSGVAKIFSSPGKLLKIARLPVEKTHPGLKKLRKGFGKAVSGIFKGGPKAAKVPPPAPRISSADASGRAARGKLRKRRGFSSTVLTQGLGLGSGGSSTGTNILSGIV